MGLFLLLPNATIRCVPVSSLVWALARGGWSGGGGHISWSFFLLALDSTLSPLTFLPTPAPCRV